MVTQFDDGKDQGALRTIGEVAQALGIRQHVLRYWEQQFPMLRPLKRSGNRRYYRAADIAMVEAIDRLVNHEGYTVKGALKALSHKQPLREPHRESHTGMIEHTSPPETAPQSEPSSSAEPAPFAPPVAGIVPSGSPLPSDGGVDAFFGRSEHAAEPVEPEPVDDVQLAQAPSLALELRAIRDRLADALAA